VERTLEVRWMTTGECACFLEVAPNMLVAEVKELVQEWIGVPVEEQRLFAGGQELACDLAVSDLDSPQVLLVRSATDPLITNLGHFRTSGDFPALPQGRL